MLKPLASAAFLFCIASCLSSCGQRAAAEAQFIGTWHRESFDSTIDNSFFPDHTFISSGESLGQYTIFARGTWYLDHKRIFLRIKDREDGELVIMNVSDVTPTQLKISHADSTETFERTQTKSRAEIEAKVGQRVEYTVTP